MEELHCTIGAVTAIDLQWIAAPSVVRRFDFLVHEPQDAVALKGLPHAAENRLARAYLALLRARAPFQVEPGERIGLGRRRFRQACLGFRGLKRIGKRILDLAQY